MRRQRRARIVVTLGPASSGEEKINALFEAGADVFRLNFSHGDREDHRERHRVIRALEEKHGRPVGVLLDLQGPKLRVGKFAGDGGVELQEGASFRLDLDDSLGDPRRVCLPHPEIFAALSPGGGLLLNDGRIRLYVTDCGADFAETKVIAGGPLSSHKGVNVPGAVLDLSPLTGKDRNDLRFGLDLGVDWVALSFVQRPEDLADARKLVAGRAGIMSKLENPQAISHLDEIVRLSDSIMVARGDLGVEVPAEDVPVLQKRMIQAARRAGKPVIVATQMLESMVDSPIPTRAETSDVATAVYDGADAVMLSAESAVGGYPVEAVATMDRILRRVEKDDLYFTFVEAARHEPENTPADAITLAARQVAQTIDAASIVTFSTTGSTTLRCARERPHVPVLGLTPKVETARKMTLCWGVHSVLTEDLRSFREMVSKAQNIASAEEFAKKGDAIVITAGVPFGAPGQTNILRIAWIE